MASYNKLVSLLELKKIVSHKIFTSASLDSYCVSYNQVEKSKPEPKHNCMKHSFKE